jgi:hypothetical protein
MKEEIITFLTEKREREKKIEKGIKREREKERENTEKERKRKRKKTKYNADERQNKIKK